MIFVLLSNFHLVSLLSTRRLGPAQLNSIAVIPQCSEWLLWLLLSTNWHSGSFVQWKLHR